MFNMALQANPFFRRNMATILNRTEFRVMQCGNKFQYDIVSHKSNVPFGCALVTSAQGGPLILPELHLEEEGFIVRDAEGKVIRESASFYIKHQEQLLDLRGWMSVIFLLSRMKTYGYVRSSKIMQRFETGQGNGI